MNLKLVNLKQLAEHLEISYARVQALVKETDFPKIKIGNRTSYRLASVQQWLDEKEMKNKNGG